MMKKLIFVLSFFYAFSVFSQWLEDVRLTNNSSESRLSRNNSKCIASSLNNVHVVWFDNRDGNSEIYYKRSTNSGVNWGSDVRLTIEGNISWYPAICAVNNNVFVTWIDRRDGNDRTYFKRSTDNGASWSADFPVSDNTSLAFLPSICVSNNVILVVWGSISGGAYKIYCKRSPDSGYSWAPENILSGSSYCGFPSIASYGEYAAVCWVDNRDGNEEIYFCKTSNLGISWGAETRVTNNSYQSTQPSISIEDRFFYLTWVDNRDGNKEIYFKSSYNYGGNWYGDSRITNAINDSNHPNIASFEDAIHIVWEDLRNGSANSEIYCKITTNRGGNWGTDTRLTNNSSLSENPHINISGSILHVIWHDFRNGVLPELYYKKNPTGNPIGIQQISTEVPAGFLLGQNYPNPFNPSTSIRFSMPKSENVKLTVYDITGKEVAILVNEELNAGVYNVDFDASHLSSGTYFYKLSTENFSGVKKMTLIK